MNRCRKLFVSLVATIAVANVACQVAIADTENGEPVSRPNILFILTDDQSPYSVGAYGNQVCQTPNIDALAARGMRIDQAYHMGANRGAVCTPSRQMIMSGRTLWHLSLIHI